MATEEKKVADKPIEQGVKKATNKVTTKPKKIKVEFLKSPTGHFNLAYSAGQQGEFDNKQAEILIDSGYAKEI